MYFVLYPLLKLHEKGFQITFSYSNKVKNQDQALDFK